MTVPLARRWALLLVASALAAGPVVVAPSASAATPTFGCASNQPCIHVTFPDGGYSDVDVPATAFDGTSGNDDIHNATYQLLTATGGRIDEYVPDGLSIQGLLALLPNGPGIGIVQSVALSNDAAGYRSSLQAGDLDDDPSPFLGGLEPVFDVTGIDSGIEYLRPQRSTNDVNYGDRFSTGQTTSTLDLQVFTSDARPLHPTVTVGEGPFKAGRPVTFSTSFAPDDPPHKGATFAWTFARGDPPTPGEQTTTNTYAAGGTYEASVEVSGTGPDGEAYAGRSPEVTVSIKGKKSTPVGKTPGGNGTGSKHHPTTGPDSSHRAHHAGSAPSGGPVAVPPAAGASATPGPTGTGGPTAAGPSAPAPTAGTSDPATDTSTNPTAPGAGGGVLVQGVLINGSSAPAGGAVASSATRVALSARRPARLTSSFDARWLWFLAPILLLVGGALGERRRVPRRHGQRSGT